MFAKRNWNDMVHAIAVLLLGFCILAISSCALLNANPTAIIRCTESFGHCPMRVTLVGIDSVDRDGVIMEYQWSISGDTIGDGAMLEYEFLKEGTYAVQLAVTDDDGDVGIAEMVFYVRGSLSGEWIGTMTRDDGKAEFAYSLVLDIEQEGDHLSGTAYWGTVDPRISTTEAYRVEVPIIEGTYDFGTVDITAAGLWRPEDGDPISPHPAFFRYELELKGVSSNDVIYGTYQYTSENESGTWFVSREDPN